MEYEKHQRDYTVMATAVAMTDFFSPTMKNFFPFSPQSMYILVRDEILYHFINKQDYDNWGRTWLENNTLDDLVVYDKRMDFILAEYYKFLEDQPKDLPEAILQTNRYIEIFMPITLIAAYVLPYGIGKISKDFEDTLLAIRKKYDNVHKSDIDLQFELLNKLEKLKGLEKNSLFYITKTEFQQFLQDESLPNILERKKLFLAEYSEQGEKIYRPQEIDSVLKNIEVQIGNEPVTEIKGNIAHQGKITGRVRIIRLIKDIEKLQTGEILVTAMTDPRYLAAMKRAAAFVTDEGGITCHAAIVARELGKPCIIGTKIATQVLQDGDEVEVDANTGIIKVLD